FETSTGRVFNYPMFLAKDGIVYQLAFAEVESTGENRGNILKASAIYLKHLYLQGVGQALPEPAAALAGGITVGDKRSLGAELSQVFINVSLIHIVVLSGYNMTVVINAAAHALAFIPRSAQFAVSGGIVALFILMTGGASSAMRAGSMALLATYARLSGRTFVALRVLAFVAGAMVLWNPYILAFDPGFQLSILATLGLVLFTEPIAKWLPWIPERFALREIAASTLGTQIAVLPLLLYQNGILSLVALPANLLTLAVVPLAMLFSFVAAISGIIFGSYATILALPAYALLSYIISVAELLSDIPYASVTVPVFNGWLLAFMYPVLFAVYMHLQRRTAEH
ncbi:MAG: competence protein ComEC, partial [Parcubacteria group bacterium Athens0416_74]